MARNSDIPPESFEEILAWLSPDRELAASMYLDLRRRLIKIFGWNHCTDPEGMTDETFDRAAKQVHELKETFEGDPKLFFYAVARNLIREYQRKIKSYVSIDDVELQVEAPHEIEEEDDADLRTECLLSCLRGLTSEKRELILGYYAKEKQAKINHRTEMAKRLGLTVETLRVRAYRIRSELEKCIEDCLERFAGKSVTD
jgi:RNA polymerase sigma factor (sigma-70 family)